MTDIFGAAAARAQQKRAAEKQNGQITLENNALVQLLQERREARAAEEAKAQAWMNEIAGALNAVADLCNQCGRTVESVTYNGEVIFARRDTEAIRLFVGKISTKQELHAAVKTVLGSIMRW
ncbi:MAG: hypothetical protein IIY16_01350 [Oscillospiraceae bacterium]|nr:hypothetical protein [Oscillospiraceae bacterium]